LHTLISISTNRDFSNPFLPSPPTTKFNHRPNHHRTTRRLHYTHPSWHSPRSPADPSVPSEPAGFSLGDHRACASTLAYTHATLHYVYVACTHARTHAAKDKNTTHSEPVPDLLVTIRRMRSLTGMLGCQVCQRDRRWMRGLDAG
jgi:hypothetical protein